MNILLTSQWTCNTMNQSSCYFVAIPLCRPQGAVSSVGTRSWRSGTLSQQDGTEHQRKFKEAGSAFTGQLRPWKWGNNQRLDTSKAGTNICSVFRRYCMLYTKSRCRTSWAENLSAHLEIWLCFWIQLGVFFSQSVGGYICSGSSFAHFQGKIQANLPCHHSAVAEQFLWVSRGKNYGVPAKCYWE